jgi:hypothetical protein
MKDQYNKDFTAITESVSEAREPVMPAEYVDEDGIHTIRHDAGIKEAKVTILVKFSTDLPRELENHVVDKLRDEFIVDDHDWTGQGLLLTLIIDSDDEPGALVGDVDLKISDILDSLQTEVPVQRSR